MGTITFKVHLITPTSLKIHTIIFKAFFYLFAFDFSLHIFLLSISCMGILEREKKYPMIFDIPILLYLSTQISLTSHFCYAETYRCHTWLEGNSGEMVINAFLLGFFSPSHQIPNDIWHSNFAMPKHTNVIDTALLLYRSIQVSFYFWRATIVRWLLMPFS